MSKYSKQKNKKTDRLKKRGQFLKAQQGVMVAETPQGGGGASGAMSSMTNTGKVGAMVGGPIGGMVGAGVGLAMHFRREKQARAERERQRKQVHNYRKFGRSANNTFEQSWGEMAKDGLVVGKKGMAPIEVEGRHNIGELVFNSDDDLVAVGETPHSQGGDKMWLEEGGWVDDSQPKGDSKKSKEDAKKQQQETLQMVADKKAGKPGAAAKLKRYKQSKPNGEAVAKNGTYLKMDKGGNISNPDNKSKKQQRKDKKEAERELLEGQPGKVKRAYRRNGFDRDLLLGGEAIDVFNAHKNDPDMPEIGTPEFDEWLATRDTEGITTEDTDAADKLKAKEKANRKYDRRLSVDEKMAAEKESAWDKLFGGMESAMEKKREKRLAKAAEKDRNKNNATTPISEKSVGQKLAVKNEQPSNPAERYIQFGSGEIMPIGDTGYVDYFEGSDPETRKEGEIYLDENNLPVDWQGNPTSTKYQQRWDDQYDKAPTADKYAELPEDQRKEAAMKDMAEGQYHWEPGEQAALAKELGINYDTDWKTFVENNYTPEDVEALGLGETDRAGNFGPKNNEWINRNYKGRVDPDEAQFLEEEIEEEQEEQPEGEVDTGRGDRAFRPNRLNEFMRNSHAISGMIESMAPIEGYNTTPLDLEEYQYRDMTAPRLKEAYKHNMVRRNNRQRLLGSKGQQVTQASQDEVLMQEASDRIVADEINRNLKVGMANTDIRNKENVHNTGEVMRGKDITRAQRAAKRNLRRNASAEIADIADVNQQREYMMERDAKQDAMQNMLYKMWQQNASTDFTTKADDLYGLDGRAHEGAGDVGLKETSKVPKKPKKKTYKKIAR